MSWMRVNYFGAMSQFNYSMTRGGESEEGEAGKAQVKEKSFEKNKLQ